MIPGPLQERLVGEIAEARTRVIEALTEATVEAAKDSPDPDVIRGYVLDVQAALDRIGAYEELLREPS